MGIIFSVIFHALSILLVFLASYNFVDYASNPQGDFMSTVIQSINTFVIALAMFELGAGINKEYISSDDEENIYFNIRRIITRFVGTVCIALVLEALIMIIKYSQLELAGNLYYPVGILFGSGFLLMALGNFLWLTKGHKSKTSSLLLEGSSRSNNIWYVESSRGSGLVIPTHAFDTTLGVGLELYIVKV
jgi:hypothetical protein